MSHRPRLRRAVAVLIGFAAVAGIMFAAHQLYDYVDLQDKGAARVAAEKAWDDDSTTHPQAATLTRGGVATTLPLLQTSLDSLHWDRCQINDCGPILAEDYPRIYTLKGAMSSGQCIRVKGDTGQKTVKAAVIAGSVTLAIGADGTFTVCDADPEDFIFGDTAIMVWAA